MDVLFLEMFKTRWKWGFEQPGLLKGVPLTMAGDESGTRLSLWCLPTKTILRQIRVCVCVWIYALLGEDDALHEEVRKDAAPSYVCLQKCFK